MRAETSKEPEKHSSLLSRKIAEGKRNENSYGQALSLQDVFSESGNPSGSSQKTSLPSDTERMKRTQLEGNVKRKKPGRRELEKNQKRAIKLQMHVTAKEYEFLNDQFRATGIRYFSDFLRILILDKRGSVTITNTKEMIKQLDSLGMQIGKIGSNINQIAKYANIQVKSGKVDRITLINFNQQMSQYLAMQKELAKAYRALVRKKG